MQRIDDKAAPTLAERGTLSDAELVRRAETTIRNSAAIDAFALTISAEAGVVSLTGEVGSYSERKIAEELARGIVGVARVHNAITVRPFGQDWAIGDDQLVAAIMRALSDLSVRENTSAITYSVLCHVATLEGKVTTTTERALIRHAVETIPGIDFVDNHIEVGS